MTDERREFVVVMDGAGDPDLIHKVWPRCALGGCNGLIRGPTVSIGKELFHKGCAPRKPTEPDPGSWRRPGT